MNTLEQKTRNYLNLKDQIANLSTERDREISGVESRYDPEIEELVSVQDQIEFSSEEVHKYLLQNGFEHVESLPWYNDLTRGVSRRLKKNPTYWKEIETAEVKNQNLLFRINQDGGYELYSLKKRDEGILQLDRYCTLGEFALSLGSTAVSTGIIVSIAYGLKNNLQMDLDTVMGLGLAGGFALGIPTTLSLIRNCSPQSWATNQEAIIKLYEKMQTDEGGNRKWKNQH